MAVVFLQWLSGSTLSEEGNYLNQDLSQPLGVAQW
jgi:hypothetical protein